MSKYFDHHGLINRDNCAWDSLRNYLLSMMPVIFGAKYASGKNDAEDIVQDAILKIYKNIWTYDPAKSNIKTFALMILRHETISYFRNCSKKIKAVELKDCGGLATESEHLQERNPWRKTLDSEMDDPKKNTLEDDIKFLSPAGRRVIEDIYFLDLTINQTSVFEQAPPGTIKSRLNTALNNLRRRLQNSA